MRSKTAEQSEVQGLPKPTDTEPSLFVQKDILLESYDPSICELICEHVSIACVIFWSDNMAILALCCAAVSLTFVAPAPSRQSPELRV